MTCHCGLTFDAAIVVQCDPNDPDSVCEPWVPDRPTECTVADCDKPVTYKLQDGQRLCIPCYDSHRQEEINEYLRKQDSLRKMLDDWTAKMSGGA